MKKRNLRVAAGVLAAVTVLTACGSPAGQPTGAAAGSGEQTTAAKTESGSTGGGEVINIEFWSLRRWHSRRSGRVWRNSIKR